MRRNQNVCTRGRLMTRASARILSARRSSQVPPRRFLGHDVPAAVHVSVRRRPSRRSEYHDGQGRGSRRTQFPKRLNPPLCPMFVENPNQPCRASTACRVDRRRNRNHRARRQGAQCVREAGTPLPDAPMTGMTWAFGRRDSGGSNRPSSDRGVECASLYGASHGFRWRQRVIPDALAGKRSGREVLWPGRNATEQRPSRRRG